jgi:ferredoxin
MNSIQRSDMAVIGTWRDNMRTDEGLARKWFDAHGMNELVNNVIARCPTKTIMLKEIKDVARGDKISSVKISDTHALEIDNANCVRCMHCINVMTGALAKGTDTGATILIGGKRTLKIGDLDGHRRRALPAAQERRRLRRAGRAGPEGDRLLRRERARARAHRRDDRAHRPGQLPRGRGHRDRPEHWSRRRAPTPTFVPTAGKTKSPASPPRNPPEESREHGHDAHPDRERRSGQPPVPAPGAAEELRQLALPRPPRRCTTSRTAATRCGACAPARSGRWTCTPSASCATSPTARAEGHVRFTIRSNIEFMVSDPAKSSR